VQRQNPNRGMLLSIVRRLPPALKMVRLDKAARSVESVIEPPPITNTIAQILLTPLTKEELVSLESVSACTPRATIQTTLCQGTPAVRVVVRRLGPPEGHPPSSPRLPSAAISLASPQQNARMPALNGVCPRRVWRASTAPSRRPRPKTAGHPMKPLGTHRRVSAGHFGWNDVGQMHGRL
jgi:hypothetical protein